MVAYTGAAGKYDPQAPMSGNEDNFYVDDNLSDNIPSHCSADDIIDMNECGCIMAVCDGMGGMNAGEVASAIAVHTIQDYFAPNNVSKDIAISAKEREKYLENVVVEADKRIKEDAKNNATDFFKALLVHCGFENVNVCFKEEVNENKKG